MRFGITILDFIGWFCRIFRFGTKIIIPGTEPNMPKYLGRGFYEQKQRKTGNIVLVSSIKKTIVDWIHLVSVPWLENSPQIILEEERE